MRTSRIEEELDKITNGKIKHIGCDVISYEVTDETPKRLFNKKKGYGYQVAYKVTPPGPFGNIYKWTLYSTAIEDEDHLRGILKMIDKQHTHTKTEDEMTESESIFAGMVRQSNEQPGVKFIPQEKEYKLGSAIPFKPAPIADDYLSAAVSIEPETKTESKTKAPYVKETHKLPTHLEKSFDEARGEKPPAEQTRHNNYYTDNYRYGMPVTSSLIDKMIEGRWN
jgi:hypothetical protein